MLLRKKKKKTVKHTLPSKPVKELSQEMISSKRFNEMINYYTRELKSRIDEIERLKKESNILISAAVKHSSEKTDCAETLKRLQNENETLKHKLHNLVKQQ